MLMNYLSLQTPIGYCTVYEENNSIVRLVFGKETGGNFTPLLRQAINELGEYFAGERRYFEIPLAPKGTPFRQNVWNTVFKVGYGNTQSYKQIAEQIHNPYAVRAVGNACHHNPIPIFIPCHRIIGKNHNLIGYAGGLKTKEFLLELEQKCL